VDGRIYLAADPLTGMVVIADGAANKVGTFGRVGDGPGELRHPSFLARKGDSLVIVQASKRQAIILTPEGRFTRELVGLEVSLAGSVFIRGDSAIVPRVVMDEQRFGYPLQLVTPEGHIVRSFGTTDRSIDPRIPLAGSRVLARASDSSVWVGSYLDSRLELWTSGGILERTVPVDLPWLIRDQSAPLGPVSQVRPQPALQDLDCCLDGYLTVIYQRPRGDWRPAADSSSSERPVLEATELLAYIEQVVVVLDPETGAVLAELSDPSTALGGFLEDGRIYGLRADESGRQLLVLMEIHRRGQFDQ
jgi:hypothetical protein